MLRKVVKNSLWRDQDLVYALGNARKVSTSSIEEEFNSQRALTPVRKKSAFMPRIRQASNILNLEQFTELLNSVPELYQVLEWDLVYSNVVHGTSFINMLRKGEHASPFILVVQDENKFIFGVYGNEKLRYSKDFYGSGETFLFTFRV